MTETKWTTFKLPTPFVRTIDEFIKNHEHEGFHTRSDVIKTSIRTFIKDQNGGNGNGGTHKSHLSTKKQHNGEDETNV